MSETRNSDYGDVVDGARLRHLMCQSGRCQSTRHQHHPPL